MIHIYTYHPASLIQTRAMHCDSTKKGKKEKNPIAMHSSTNNTRFLFLFPLSLSLSIAVTDR